MGAAIATLYAHRNPEQVTKLCLISAAGLHTTPAPTALRLLLRYTPVLAEVVWQLVAPKALFTKKALAEGWVAPHSHSYFEDYAQRYAQRARDEVPLLRSLFSTMRHVNFQGQGPESVRATTTATTTTTKEEEEEGKIIAMEDVYDEVGLHQRSVLLLWGENDTTTPHTVAMELLSKMPRSRLVSVQDAGHDAILEFSPLCSKKIAEFVLLGEEEGGGRSRDEGNPEQGQRTAASNDDSALRIVRICLHDAQNHSHGTGM